MPSDTPQALRAALEDRLKNQSRQSGVDLERARLVLGVISDEVEVLLVDREVEDLHRVVGNEHGVEGHRREERNVSSGHDPDRQAGLGLGATLEVAGELVLDRAEGTLFEQLEARATFRIPSWREPSAGVVEKGFRTPYLTTTWH